MFIVRRVKCHEPRHMSTKKSCDQNLNHFMRFWYLYLQIDKYLGDNTRFRTYRISEQRRLRQACALTQSRQSPGFSQTQSMTPTKYLRSSPAGYASMGFCASAISTEISCAGSFLSTCISNYRGLTFALSIYLRHFFVCANSEGSGKVAH